MPLLNNIIPWRGSRRELARRDDPFNYLRSQINRVFDDAFGGGNWPAESAATFTPQLDVTETDKEIRICAELPGIEIGSPPGAMYAFFRLRGLRDSLSFCKQLVHDGKVGLAPGSAFGAEGEGFLRWCFASDTSRLAEGVARFSRFLASRDSK